MNINCDMGEGMSTDADIMPYISACSIACGGHTGDRQSMLQTASLAAQHGVSIGAHPSYPDKVNFGRKSLTIDVTELFDSLSEQVRALQSVLVELNQPLVHIKPHGALYNRAAVDTKLAVLLVRLVESIDPNLVLFGLADSALELEAVKANIPFKREFFIDRNYADDGTLLPRSNAQAVLHDVPFIVTRTKTMHETKQILSWQGNKLNLQADTYCLHGDHPKALQLAQALAAD